MNPASKSVALVPLDERPVNTRYPVMLAAIAGFDVHLPPVEIRGLQRTPADLKAVASWLTDACADNFCSIVSCDYLAFGNLINARISLDTSAVALTRLDLLCELPCPVHAFSLITRVSNADDNVEEPLYWSTWGTKLYRYAALTHKVGEGDATSDEKTEWETLHTAIPGGVKTEWLARRLRNHTVNLGLLEMAACSRIDTLLITSDDTSAYGFPSREKQWLSSWKFLLDDSLSDKVLMHPGADEVGSALLARVITRRQSQVPKVAIDYALEGDRDLVAPYEDRPVFETVEGQIHACGAAIVRDTRDADFILAVATPVPGRRDYRPEYLEQDRPRRSAAYADFVKRIAHLQQAGHRVALADVAYPNGADPLLMDMLLSADTPVDLAKLAAYGAWNTAGNTLGVVAAQAVCSLFMHGSQAQAAAQQRFLTHRFLEDWGYQTVVRRAARAECTRLWHRAEPDPESSQELAATCGFIEERLTHCLIQLQAVGVGTALCITPGTVRLPWRRTFEVDFDLMDVG